MNLLNVQQMKVSNRFVVHVYGFPDMQEKKFSDYVEAYQHAVHSFNKSNVYKVKVWDITKGNIEPNRPNARALILELV